MSVSVIAWTTADRWDLHVAPFRYLALAALAMAGVWLPGMHRVWRRHHRLRGKPLAFIAPPALERKVGRGSDLWLGWGFDWTGTRPAGARPAAHRPGPPDWKDIGAPRRGLDSWPWHAGAGSPAGTGAHRGSSPRFRDHWCGKTRLFDLLVTQAALRREVVVIIDPKGDQDLKGAAERACRSAGEPGRFVHFHPAFPLDSARINPLHSFNRATEVASRVAALIPSETGNDPFKAFGQMAMSNVVQGLLAVGERPSLVTLRRYLEGGAESLVERVLVRYLAEHVPSWENEAKPFLHQARHATARVAGLVRYYRESVSAPPLHRRRRAGESLRARAGALLQDDRLAHADPEHADLGGPGPAPLARCGRHP